MSPRSSALRVRPAALALMALVALTASTLAWAAPPDPLDARATTKPLQHRSAFDGYRRFADEPGLNWREANDTVKRIGGWRSYARETAPSAAPAPSSASAPASAPAHKH